MTTRAQFQAMQTTLEVAVPRMHAEAAREALAEAASRERARVLSEQGARAGIAPTDAIVVDGVAGGDPERVRPDGYILLEFGYVREVALVVLGALRHAGPVVKGIWSDTLTILADGAETDPRRIPHHARDIHVVATTPYARRLEIGKTRRGDPFVLDDSDYRLLERTARRVATLYRQVAKVEFTYVDLAEAYALSNRTARTGRGGGQVRYPAVRIAGWQVLQ